MSRRPQSLDTEVERWADAAKAFAKAKGIGAAEALASITNGIPRTRTPFIPYFLDPIARRFVVEKSFEAFTLWWEARLKTLRLDLEAALMRLDACCSPLRA